MSFMSLAFLLALPLVAAPLLLHLFDRRRNAVIGWGAMQFLMEASAQKTSARRLRQWLLLLLRCLAIAALVFALARPLLPSKYLGGNERSETILVIDNSMSMLRSTQDAAMIDAAISRATELLAELPAHSDVRMLTTAPYPVWAGTGPVRNDQPSRDWLQGQIEKLSATQGRSDLLAALFTAVQAEREPTQSSRRIVVLTDGQAADWKLDDQSGWTRLQEAISKSPIPTEIETIRLDESDRPASKGNVAIERLTLRRTIVGVGQPTTISAQIHNYDDAKSAGATIRWEVDGIEKHRAAVDPIDGGQSLAANWEYAFDTPGTFRVNARLDHEDDLPADNDAKLVVEVVDRVPIVIVEDAFELAEMQQDSFLVQAALGWIDGAPLTDTSIYVPTLVSLQELASTDLTNQRVVVIPNLTRLSEEVIQRLTDFVSDGGGLWIGLGARTDVDSFNRLLFADASGLSPVKIDRIVDTSAEGDAGGEAGEDAGGEASADVSGGDKDSGADDAVANDIGADEVHRRRLRIDPYRSVHPATRQLVDDKQLDLADVVIGRRFAFVAGESNHELSVLLKLSNGQALAAENFVGRGRVIVQAVPLRLQWTDLAKSQSFVVMVRDWVDYLAQPHATQYNLQPGEPIVMRMPESEVADGSDAVPYEAPTAILRTPQGDAIELTATQREGAFEFRSSRTRLPGEYQLEIGLAERATPFQVLRDAPESDLNPLSADQRQQITALTTASVSKEQDLETASAQTSPLWPYLLIGLIVLITGDLVLSGMLARERFGSAGIPEFSEIDTSALNPLPLDSLSARNGSTHPGSHVGTLSSEVK